MPSKSLDQSKPEATAQERPFGRAEQLAEELAACVVLADASDAGSLRAALGLLGDIEGALANGPDQAVRAVQRATALIVSVMMKDSDDPLRDMDTVAGHVTEIQEALRNATAVVPAVKPEEPRPAPGPVDSGGRDAETVSLLGEFLQDSEEGISNADTLLLDVESNGVSDERVNALFRVFHSLKGVAGFLALGEIASLAHSTETLLNKVRQGEMSLSGPVLDVTFDATALLRKMLAEVRRAVESGEPVGEMADLPGLLLRLAATIEGTPPPAEPLPAAEAGDRLGEIVQRPPAAVPEPSVASALNTQKESGRPLGEELVARELAPAKAVGQSLRAQKQANDSRAEDARMRETVKVDLARIDALVELVGELAVVESMVVNDPAILGLSAVRVRRNLSQLSKISRDLQDIGLRMRMLPIAGVFQKMARLVRDLAAKSGKKVRLVTSGEGTELDRSVVEQIHDPLVHMVRNAVDHAIERPDERVRAGKDAQGTVRLSAFHEGGHVVLTLEDDGRGLDREAILKKARAQGLVKEGETLSDAEVHQLIFLPGFSTAKQVTEISGRGVGMDVVRRNIEAMRGRIGITSVPSRGTTFRVHIPLTLAIIDGMLVECGAERFILPTLSVLESILPDRGAINAFTGKYETITVRGEVIPLLRLDRILGVTGAKTDAAECLVVIVEAAGRKVGLLVDDIAMRQQVVIKRLDGALGEQRCLAGGAILPDGRVGLILNVDEIGNLAQAGC